jgi:hypothetical protein
MKFEQSGLQEVFNAISSMFQADTGEGMGASSSLAGALAMNGGLWS